MTKTDRKIQIAMSEPLISPNWPHNNSAINVPHLSSISNGRTAAVGGHPRHLIKNRRRRRSQNSAEKLKIFPERFNWEFA